MLQDLWRTLVRDPGVYRVRQPNPEEVQLAPIYLCLGDGLLRPYLYVLKGFEPSQLTLFL